MTDFLSTYGLEFIFAIVLIEEIGLPIPAIPALIVAGALAADGKLSLPGLFIVTIVAALLAESAWYYAGERYGNRVMKLLCRISLTPDLCVNQTQELFERWGINALIFAKFIPGLSIITPPLAGATHMGWPRFVIYSSLGTFLWVAAGALIGIIFKAQINHLLIYLKDMGTMVITILGALLAVYVAYKWWERRRFFAMLRAARINVDELYSLMSTGESPVIVDVRSHTARALNPRRIPGAMHVPLHAIDHHAKGLPRDRDIILYCTCPNEASAAEAAKLLMNSGFKRVRPLSGGLDAWIASGYSIEEI